MKRNIYIALSALALCAAGCEQNRMEEYRNSPAIYFHWSNLSGEQRDAVNHSFFLHRSDVTQDTVWVRVNAMGRTEPVARPIAIVQSNAGEPGAAVAGTHYKLFDTPGIAEKMVIPANAANTLIPVVVLRDRSLDAQQVRLELAVVGNEYFRPGIEAWRKFTVTTTNVAEKPRLWDEKWSGYFGPSWGSRKFRFIIDHTGYTAWDIIPEDGYAAHMQVVVTQKYDEYRRDHPDWNTDPDSPLLEADGTEVKFK